MNSQPRLRNVCSAACFLILGAIQPLAVSSQDLAPKPLKKVLPEYPDALKKMGISGTARLRITIATDGTVKDLEVLGGSAILAESASKAVKQWRYPASEKQRIAVVTVEFECCNTVRTSP
jgi:TonB family protein